MSASRRELDRVQNREIPCIFPWNREFDVGDGFARDCPLSQTVRVSPRFQVEALKPRRFPGFPGPIPNRRPPRRRWLRRERSRRLYCRPLRFGLRGLAWVSRCRAAASAPARRSAGPGSGSGGARSVRQAGAPLGFEAVELGAGLGRLRLLGVDFRRQRGYSSPGCPVKTFSSRAPFIPASRFLIR